MDLRYLVVSGFLLTACGDSGSSSGGAAPSPSAVSEAKKIFETRCTPCHGPGGKGDGPSSATLDPKPRNFSDKAWQDSVKDDHIQKIIVGGGPAVGKNAAMPANPDLENKPQVVAALKDVIRSFSGK